VQTTLLGLAIAMILALVAALVAPLVVDWNHYRTAFENEVGRLTGLSVRVGSIDARILPSPIIKLRDVEIGEAGGAPQLRAASLELEVRLGALLRGRIEATQAHLVAPQFTLSFDRSGAIVLPGASRPFQPEELSIARLRIEDGSMALADASSGARVVLQKLSFDGDIRSLAGPFKGEGAFIAGGEPYAYRISGGQADDNSGFKIRLGVDPQNHPLTTNVEGTLTFDRGVPQFAGTFALMRPVGVALSNGQRVMNDPWRATGSVKAMLASASVQDIAFQYGPDERAINFGGKADLTFGQHPHFAAELKALAVDADRALAAPDVTRQPPLLIVKSFAEAFVTAASPPMPGEVALGIDGLTVGGTTIQSLHGTMRFDDGGWSLEGLDFRAPGLTDVTVSGRLKQTAQGLAFTGPAALQSADVAMLMAWLGGHSGLPSGQTGTFSAHGDVSIAGDRMAVDRLTAQLNQESLNGRFAYARPVNDQPAIVEADLHATTLDLDGLTAFATSAFGGNGFELPRAGSLALDIGKATFGGVDARAVKTQVKFDAGALQIEHLSIGALAGAALDVNGRIDALSSQPSGRFTADLDARELAGLAAIAGKFAPQAADLYRRAADRLSPAKVHAVVTVDRAATGNSTAKLDLNGQLGLMRLAVNGGADVELSRPGSARLHLDSRLDADDGTVLAALFGVDRLLGVDQLPGRATLTADGPLNGDIRVDGELAGSGLDAAVRGTLQVQGETAPKAVFQMLATAADLRPLQQAMTGQAGDAVPVSARAAVTVSGTDLSLTQIAVAAGKASANGHLTLSLASPVAIDGDVTADNVDGARIVALMLGLPRQAPGTAGFWSSQPVAAGAFAAISGAVTFNVGHAAFMPGLTASDLKGVVRFRPSEIAFDNLDGTLAGGHLSGQVSLRRTADGLVSHGHVELADADAASLLQADKTAIAARLALKLDGDSIGASPAALVGAIHGGGSIGLSDAHLAGLDPAAFPAAMRAADQANATAPAKILAAVNAALGSGRLVVPQGEAAATITSGKINVANVTLRAQDGSALALAGALDLGTGAIDARLTLSAEPPPHALIRARPELAIALNGPLAAPARSLDISALTGWLALRAAELQTRRLESLEANGRREVIGRAIRPDFAAVRTAPRGTLVEYEFQASAPVQGKPRLDLLQPQLPSAADAGAVGDIKPRSSPPPRLAAPRTAGPDKNAPLDLLRPQN
jgi:AsmA-like C-terminal region/AsmA family